MTPAATAPKLLIEHEVPLDAQVLEPLRRLQLLHQ